MTALTQDVPITRSIGEHADYPVLAATKVWEGSAVGLTTAGYARGFVLGDKFRGHASGKTDNLTGASGDKYARTLRGRYYLKVALGGVAITDGVRSAAVYLQDSGTLSLREGLLVGRVVRYVSSGYAIVEFDTDLPVVALAETVAFGDFTDNSNATGYIDLSTALPEGAIVVGWQADVRTGFTGNTSATAQLGVSGNVNRFSANAVANVFAVDVVGSAPLNADASDNGYLAAATTVRCTVTGDSDFGAISAGEMDLKVLYIPPLAV